MTHYYVWRVFDEGHDPIHRRVEWASVIAGLIAAGLTAGFVPGYLKLLALIPAGAGGLIAMAFAFHKVSRFATLGPVSWRLPRAV